ncbi:MAG TPA: DUF5597 domain-containing protein, partial [Bryobacteraceae bacterium]|nr:DUF5597 domain-containing protein [Bryobacteraceae bacterium]
MNGITRVKAAAGLALALAALAGAAAAGEIPRLERHGARTRLLVDGKPFAILGGELHNSTASSLEYLEPVWPRLAGLHLNTVLATVSWELIEPQEGQFDWTLVDGVIRQARLHKMRLVLLWFGSWKNGVSSYAPLWVKTDLRRFPRAQNKGGRNLDVVSPFCAAARAADARAFRMLMRHLKETDGSEHTVLMVQIENEAGIKRNSRDYSSLAGEAYARPVAPALIRYLTAHRDQLLPETRELWSTNGYRTSGTWSEVFGNSEWMDEAFMAWHFGRYMGTVASEGKKEYPLPMFVNAWLQGPGQTPGIYPCGGPVARVMDFWRAAAPEIDLIAPDIYLPDFKGITAEYTRLRNPLFIPEAGRGADAAAKAFYAFGQHGAIGFSPFGIDSVEAGHPIGRAYSLLEALTPAILEDEGNGRMAGVLLEKNEKTTIDIDGRRLTIGLDDQRKAPTGYGLIVVTGPGRYLAAGSNLAISFGPVAPKQGYVRLGSVDEMIIKDGRMLPRRCLN